MTVAFVHRCVLALLFPVLTGFCATAQARPPRTVVILGNSIVRHAPAPALGWYGDWGMAASAADSDFVHRIIARIRATGATETVVRYANIADFERNYTTYALQALDSLAGSDLLVVKLSENVDDFNALQRDFIRHYTRLLDGLDPQRRAIRVIASGFWHAPQVERVLRNYAAYHGYPYVPLSDLSDDAANRAGTFSNPGVAAHPSDEGMRAIADRLWAVLQAYF